MRGLGLHWAYIHFMLFVSYSLALGTQREHIFWWNMGITGHIKPQGDKSTIFGMWSLWGLTINSGRGADNTTKYPTILAFNRLKGTNSVRLRFNQAEVSKFEILIHWSKEINTAARGIQNSKVDSR